jgi:hypothetical protein
MQLWTASESALPLVPTVPINLPLTIAPPNLWVI